MTRPMNNAWHRCCPGRPPMRHFISPSILLTLFNNRTSYAEWRRHWLKYLVVQPAALYLYACLPRLLLTLATKDSELPLTRGVLDRRLAYVSVVLAVYHLPRLAQPTLARRLVLVYAHLDFLT